MLVELLPIAALVLWLLAPRIELPGPEPKDCSQRPIKLFYSKTPGYRCDTIGRVAIISRPPFEEQLRQEACNIGADTVLFIHRVGDEISGIAAKCYR